MSRLQFQLAILSLVALAVTLLPFLAGSAAAPFSTGWFVLLAAGLFMIGSIRLARQGSAWPILVAAALLSTAGAIMTITALADPESRGAGFWCLLVSAWLSAWLLVERLSDLPDGDGLVGQLVQRGRTTVGHWELDRQWI